MYVYCIIIYLLTFLVILKESHKPKTKEKDVIGKKLPEQNSDMKDLQRKLRKLQKEVEASKRDGEELKNSNKRLVIENRNLSESNIQKELDLKIQNQQLIENIDVKKNKFTIDNIEQNESFWKARIQEYRNFQRFADFLKSNVWSDSITLPFASEQLHRQIEKVRMKYEWFID